MNPHYIPIERFEPYFCGRAGVGTWPFDVVVGGLASEQVELLPTVFIRVVGDNRSA
jgi:hypothetical protein